jgi:serine/threonine protein kinase
MSIKVFTDVNSVLNAIQGGETLIAKGDGALRSATLFERASLAFNRKVRHRDPQWLQQNNGAVSKTLTQLITQSNKTWSFEETSRLARTLSFAGLGKVAQILIDSQTRRLAPASFAEALGRQQDVLANLLPQGDERPEDIAEIKNTLIQYAKTQKTSDLVLVAALRKLDEAEAAPNELKRAQITTQALEDFHLQALGYGTDLVTELSQAKLVKGSFLGEGGLGTVSRATLDGKEKVLKEFNLSKNYPIELDPSSPDSVMAPRLLRSPEIASVFLRQSESEAVIVPSHFIVREKNGSKTRELLVPQRDKEFRAWAKKQLADHIHDWNYSLEIVGEVQDLAPGYEVGDLVSQGKLDEHGLKQITAGFLDALDSLGKRGFVHRDIKPQNAFFDPSTGKLKLIDVGSLAKLSKNIDQRPNTAFSMFAHAGVTLNYSLPAKLDAPNGFAQDLYAAGMSIVETAIKVQASGVNTGQAIALFQEFGALEAKIDSIRNAVLVGSTDAEVGKKQILDLLRKSLPLTNSSSEVVGLKALEYALTAKGQWDDLRDREQYCQIIAQLKSAL